MTTQTPAAAQRLRTHDDVLALIARASRPALRPPAAAIHVDLPGVAPTDATRAELRLNAAAQDCGCNMGSAFMSVGLVGSTAYLWVALGSPLAASPSQLAIAGAVTVACAVAGKLAGLARARIVLVRGLENLAAQAAFTNQEGGT